jgi:hypothetical protein
LSWPLFKQNFEKGLEHAQHRRQMRLDFTLTLPGMFEVNNIQQLAKEYNVELLTKIIFSFSPDIVLSPLALPRHLLEPWIDELLQTSTDKSMQDLLTQLKTRPTFEEQWPDSYQQALVRGKQRLLKLESIRDCPVNMLSILKQRPDIEKWFHEIS